MKEIIYNISIKDRKGEYISKEVPEEVYIYIKQLEQEITYNLGFIKKAYPERFIKTSSDVWLSSPLGKAWKEEMEISFKQQYLCDFVKDIKEETNYRNGDKELKPIRCKGDI